MRMNQLNEDDMDGQCGKWSEDFPPSIKPWDTNVEELMEPRDHKLRVEMKDVEEGDPQEVIRSPLPLTIVTDEAEEEEKRKRSLQREMKEKEEKKRSDDVANIRIESARLNRPALYSTYLARKQLEKQQKAINEKIITHDEKIVINQKVDAMVDSLDSLTECECGECKFCKKQYTSCFKVQCVIL